MLEFSSDDTIMFGFAIQMADFMALVWPSIITADSSLGFSIEKILTSLSLQPVTRRVPSYEYCTKTENFPYHFR